MANQERVVFFVGNKESDNYNKIVNILRQSFEVREYRESPAKTVQENSDEFYEDLAACELVVLEYGLPECGFVYTHASFIQKKCYIISSFSRLPGCVEYSAIGDIDIIHYSSPDEILEKII